MPADTFRCPQCNASLCRAPLLRVGDPVLCPRCGGRFPCPAPTDQAELGILATPTTLDQAPTTTFTETPSSPQLPTPDEDALPLPLPSADVPDTDHLNPHRRHVIPLDRFHFTRLDLSPIHQACQHFGRFVLPAAHFCVLFGIILFTMVFVPCLGFTLGLFVLPPLRAGITSVALAQLKGQRWTFGDFFSGFKWSAATTILTSWLLLISLLLLPLICLIEDPFLWIEGGPVSDVIALSLALSGVALFAFLYTRLFTFALPLVIDRNYGPAAALNTSWALTRRHFWKLLGLNLLLGLMNAGGALVVLGLLLSVPFSALVWSACYLQLAGTQPPVSPREPSRKEQERYDAF